MSRCEVRKNFFAEIAVPSGRLFVAVSLFLTGPKLGRRALRIFRASSGFCSGNLQIFKLRAENSPLRVKNFTLRVEDFALRVEGLHSRVEGCVVRTERFALRMAGSQVRVEGVHLGTEVVHRCAKGLTLRTGNSKWRVRGPLAPSKPLAICPRSSRLCLKSRFRC
jgi:hypothetical protein